MIQLKERIVSDGKCFDGGILKVDNFINHQMDPILMREMAKELVRTLKDGGVIVWVVADQTINGSESGTSFKQALYFKELGLNIHDTMIWRKINPMPNNHGKRYFSSFEYMFVFSKNTPKTFNPIMEPCKCAGQL